MHPGQEVQARGTQRPDPHRRTLHQVQVSWPNTRTIFLFLLFALSSSGWCRVKRVRPDAGRLFGAMDEVRETGPPVPLFHEALLSLYASRPSTLCLREKTRCERSQFLHREQIKNTHLSRTLPKHADFRIKSIKRQTT